MFKNVRFIGFVVTLFISSLAQAEIFVNSASAAQGRPFTLNWGYQVSDSGNWNDAVVTIYQKLNGENNFQPIYHDNGNEFIIYPRLGTNQYRFEGCYYLEDPEGIQDEEVCPSEDTKIITITGVEPTPTNVVLENSNPLLGHWNTTNLDVFNVEFEYLSCGMWETVKKTQINNTANVTYTPEIKGKYRYSVQNCLTTSATDPTCTSWVTSNEISTNIGNEPPSITIAQGSSYDISVIPGETKSFSLNGLIAKDTDITWRIYSQSSQGYAGISGETIGDRVTVYYSADNSANSPTSFIVEASTECGSQIITINVNITDTISLNEIGQETFIPIGVDGITIFIPHHTSSNKEAVYRDRDGNLFVTLNDGTYLKLFFETTSNTWHTEEIDYSDIKLINLYATDTELTVTSNSAGYSSLTLSNVNDFGTLNFVGSSSGYGSYQLDIPLTSGAKWLPNRIYPEQASTFMWKIPNGTGCTDETGRSVASAGIITYSGSAGDKVQKLIQCNGKSYQDTLLVLPSSNITLPTINDYIEGETGTIIGAIPDDFNVGSMGNAEYSIAITTAPASGGFVPEISLRYNSSGDNGYLGVGWSISGLSSMSYCGKQIVHDNETGPLEKDSYGNVLDSARLCLDGKRLITDAVDYHAEGNVYKPYDNSIIEVTKISSSLFEAKLSNGEINFYEKRRNSFPLIKKQDAAGNSIFYNYSTSSLETIPRLTSVIYNSVSNIITEGPSEAANGLYFYYEDRDDIIKTRNVTPTKITKRLDKVVSKTNSFDQYSGDEIRTYDLHYDYAEVSRRSLIKSIDSCVGNTCLKPTIFDWQEGNLEVAENTETVIHGNNDDKGHRALDANGDGITDFVMVRNDSGNSSDHVKIIKGGTVPTRVQTRENLGTQTFRQRWQIIDYNNDGRDDILGANNGTWKIYPSIIPNNNPDDIEYDFDNPIELNVDDDIKSMVSGDFDGNGYPDLVYYFEGGLYLIINKGQSSASSFELPQQVYFFRNDLISKPFLSEEYHLSDQDFYNYLDDNFKYLIRVADTNGDGFSELIIALPSEYGVSKYDDGRVEHKIKIGAWHLFNYDRTNIVFNRTNVLANWHEANYINFKDGGPTYHLSDATVAKNISYIDFNADGLPEKVSLKVNGDRSGNYPLVPPSSSGYDNFSQLLFPAGLEQDLANAELYYYLSVPVLNNSSSYNPTYQGLVVSDAKTKEVSEALPYLFTDYDSDGYVDVLYYINDTVNTNNGTKYWRYYSFNGESYHDAGFTNIEYIYNKDGINTFGEVNGDGVPDYISFQGRINYQLSESDKRDMLTTITNGFGKKIVVNYKSMAAEGAGSLYKRDGDAEQALEQDERCDQATGDYCGVIIDYKSPMQLVQSVIVEDKSDTTYQYAGLKAQLGEGMLGFRQVTSYEKNTSTVIKSNFSQIFPYSFKLEKMERFYRGVQQGEYCPGMGSCVQFDQIDNQLLSSQQFDYRQHPEHGFVYLYKNISNTYDPDDETLQTIQTVTNTELDHYANVKNSKTTVANGFGNVHATTTSIREFNDYGGNVFGGRLTKDTTTYDRSNTSSITQVTNYTYDENNHYLLQTKEVNGGSAIHDNLSANFYSKETYERDNVGNITLLIKEGSAAQTQAQSFHYDNKGRYVTDTYQYLGDLNGKSAEQIQSMPSLHEHIDYHPVLGLPVTITNANGQTVTNKYSAFGRLYYTGNIDGSYVTVFQELCTLSGDCPPDAYYVESTSLSNGPNSKVYYNDIGLKLLEKTEALSDALSGTISWVQKRYGYDKLNRLVTESVPHFEYALPALSNTDNYSINNLPPLGYSLTIFDQYQRVTTNYKPDHSEWTTTYSGLSSTQTNPDNHTTTTVKNILGETVTVTDADLTDVNYSYNALGLMTRVERTGNDGNVVTEMKYDHLGRKVEMLDPDSGKITYQYDGLGNLLWQRDAKNQQKCNIYDGLGRIKREYHIASNTCSLAAIKDQDIEYTYDGELYGQGLVSYVYDHVNDISKQYYYNEMSLSYRITSIIDGTEYYQDTVYDPENYFRVSKTYDASSGDAGVKYQYNSDNYLISKTDLKSNINLWQLHRTDAFGNATSYEYGNGITTTTEYDEYDGTIESILAQGSSTLQNSEYQFDRLGNLEYRINNFANTSFTETFTYDNLNRLDTWTKTGGNASGVLDVDYDVLGNIKFKTGIGSYHYNNSRPHAVDNITGGAMAGSYGYDANGNMTSGGGRSNITYNVNNKPTKVLAGSHETRFTYSIGGARVKRTDIENNISTDTLYLGNVEFITKNEQLIRIQRNIEGIAIETYFASTNIRQLEYLHFDHLGSAELITDENGNEQKRFSFDPWGQRRSIENYNTSYGINSGLSLALNYYNKGYTGHEHMDESGLIHMNGRIYDPRLGRFLNADPAVQQEYNLQNFNRYSYVLNNPLNATDPSGYFWNVLVNVGMAMLSDATTTEIIQMGLATALSGGDQFTYSSADGFSTGGNAQSSLESQLFDSYDLGGGFEQQARAIIEAKLDPTSLYSGVCGNKYLERNYGTASPIKGNALYGFGLEFVNGASMGIIAGDVASESWLNAGPIMNAHISAYREQAGMEQYAMALTPARLLKQSSKAVIGYVTKSASDLPVVKPGTKDWDNAVNDLSGLGKGKMNIRTETATDAKALLKEARGNMDRRKNYTNDSYKKGYETHNVQNQRELGAGNDLQHVKWKDGKSGGHIYYDKAN